MDLTNPNKDRKPKRRNVDLNTMVYGKIPPQAREFEEAVLGAIMLDKNCFDRVNEILTASSFYVESHGRIFAAMLSLNMKNQPIDGLTVVEELKFREELDSVGGPYYVTKLTGSVVSSANIEAHCQIIQQKFLQREMIRISGETINSAYEDCTDVFDLIESHEKQLTDLTTNSRSKSLTHIDDALLQSVTRIEELRAKKEHITGVASGITELDRLTHGWQDSDLIILAARPSVGKTAFALKIARHAALNPYKQVPVAFFSLEMSTRQLMNRILSAESGIYLDNIVNGQLDDEQMKTLYSKGIHKLLKKKIFFDDTPALTLFDLKTKVRKVKRTWKKIFGQDEGLIILDYLQLMSGENERRSNREQEIAQISRGLKGLAKEINNPLIALSQLSRDVEKRGGEKKMPVLSDLRESGAIEQDADLVMFLYRPEYYDQKEDGNGESTQGLTEIKISKNRNGKLGLVKMKANLSIQEFSSWEGAPPVEVPSGFRPVKMWNETDRNEDF